MVGEHVVAPLAVRRASRTCFEGTASFDAAGIDIDARTGASIRGKSMVDVVLVCRRGYLEAFANRPAYISSTGTKLAPASVVCCVFVFGRQLISHPPLSSTWMIQTVLRRCTAATG